MKPGACVSPVSLGGSKGNGQGVGGLGHRQPGKKSQFHKLRRGRVDLFQPVQGVVQRQQLIRAIVGSNGQLIEIQPLGTTPVPITSFPPRIFDENSPHCFRRGGKEVPAAIPVRGLLDVHQPDVGCVHERGSLKRLSRLLVYQPLRRQPPQFIVNQRQKLAGGVRITLIHGVDQPRRL